MELNNNVDIRVNNFFPVFYLRLLFIFLILSVSALGQKMPSQKDVTGGSNPININLPANMQPSANKVLLDKKIDPATYILGPGDILSIFTWGNFQGQYQLTISPEGMLLIPEIGPIEVAGLTLSEARAKVASEIQSRYRNVESIVSLVDLRTFKVFIGGAVTTPGAYPATAVTRVSEVIELAGGFLGEDKEKDQSMGVLLIWNDWDKKPAKRDISVFRQKGDTLKADILRFNLTGDPEFNPLLQDGDDIFVPVRHSLVNVYGIFGAIRNPGYFEFSSRDSLRDIISLGHGLTIDADSHSVEIVRFQPDNKSTQSLYVDLCSSDWNIPLKSDDRIYIKPIESYHEKYQVQLIGEFKYPGFYAITEDSSTLSEIAAKAGGLTDIASLEEAEMTRVSAEELVDPEFERLKKMTVADMSESEYEYFKIKARSKVGRVAIDFKGIFIDHDSKKDILLRDSDVITVPRKRQVVSVTGEVANPGFQTYIPGSDYEYYIKMAGGFSDRAGTNRISIIKGTTGEWKSPKKGRPLEAGDTVLIPEKKKHNYLGIIKDVAVFTGNLATIYLVVRQASQ